MNTPTVLNRTATTENNPSRTRADSNGARQGAAGNSVDFVNPDSTGQDLDSSLLMLTLILDAIPQPIYWKDRNLVFQGCNTAFSTVTGHKKQAIIGKTDFDLSDESVAIKYREEDEKVMQSGRPLIDYESLLISRDGEQMWESVSKLPLINKQGNTVGLLGMSRNITETKFAKEALRASEERFSAAFERSASGMSLTSAGDGCFLQANQAFCDMLGYTEEELRCKTFQELAFPDDLESGGSRLDLLMAGKVNTALVEGRYLDKDGDDIWLLVSAAMIRDAEDQPLYVISQVQDISERKKSEVALRDSDEQLHILFDSAPDAYFLLDHQGTFIDGNQAAEKMTGYHRLELFRNNFFEVNLLSAADMRKMGDRLAKVSEDKVVGPDEYILTRKDGVKVPIEMRCFLVTIQDLPVVLSIARDISERKKTESRLADMHRQLLHHSRQAGRAEVATTVLHDVGNVLNSINVSSSLVVEKVRKSHISALPHTVDLLQKHKDDLAGFFENNLKGKKLTAYLGKLSSHLLTEQNEIIEELVLLGRNIEHVKEIIAMQQAYTKISSDSEMTDLKQLVEDSLRMFIRTLQQHNIQVVRDYDPTPAIMLEKHKLMQVLVNLIQNSKIACKESGRTEPELRLRIRTKKDCVSISIIDNGVGIEPENLSRLFNYGFTTREEGNGFGLYSAALAMQEIGGSLSAHSDGPGHGAVFTLELPIPAELALHE